MDIPQLQAFLAVSETGSFSLAAERLHLTQPAVSKRIALLEETLSTVLFDRIGHQISLSEAGRTLLPRARDILLAVADSRRAVQSLGQSVSGPLAMGTSHHIGLHRLPPLLKDYSRRYPEVRLDLSFEDSEVACQRVEQGSLELAVITLPPGTSPRLKRLPVWQDPLVFVAAPEHPLSRRDSVSLDELAASPALLLGRNTFTWTLIEAPFKARGLKLSAAMSTNYLETLAMLTQVGLGWSVLPAIMSKELRVLEVPGVSLSRELGIVYHESRSLSNAARAMIGLLQNTASLPLPVRPE
ncbi:MAG: LysR family transcriptional regulator [Gammaproteobacteria bacterium]|nr:LysR family transcriptional regulator [Gammaproteobacteria bacterium]